MEDKVRYVKLDVEIDEPIADLIIELNRNHLQTKFCCCGHEMTTQIILHGSCHEPEYIPVKNDHPHIYITFANYDLTNGFVEYLRDMLTDGILENRDGSFIKYKIKKEYAHVLTQFRTEYNDNKDEITIRLYYTPNNFEESRQYAVECLNKGLNQFIENV